MNSETNINLHIYMKKERKIKNEREVEHLLAPLWHEALFTTRGPSTSGRGGLDTTRAK